MDRNLALYILGLKEGASKEVIKKRYKELIKKTHPDMKNGDAQLFLVIKECYEYLETHGNTVPYVQKEDIVEKMRKKYKEQNEKETEKSRLHFDDIPSPIEESEEKNNEENDNIKEEVKIENETSVVVEPKPKRKETLHIELLKDDKLNNNIEKNNDENNLTKEKNEKNFEREENKNSSKSNKKVVNNSITYEEIVKNYTIYFSHEELKKVIDDNQITKRFRIDDKFYEIVFTAGDVFYNLNKKFYLKENLTVKIGKQTRQYVIISEIKDFINSTIVVDVPKGFYPVDIKFAGIRKKILINKFSEKTHKATNIFLEYKSPGRDIYENNFLNLKIIFN